MAVRGWLSIQKLAWLVRAANAVISDDAMLRLRINHSKTIHQQSRLYPYPAAPLSDDGISL